MLQVEIVNDYNYRHKLSDQELEICQSGISWAVNCLKPTDLGNFDVAKKLANLLTTQTEPEQSKVVIISNEGFKHASLLFKVLELAQSHDNMEEYVDGWLFPTKESKDTLEELRKKVSKRA